MHKNLTPGASNPRASGQLGVWGRCKTERGDREDRDGVLTRSGGRRNRPESKSTVGGFASSPARLQQAAARGEQAQVGALAEGRD
jgi:hypothetical protein